MITVVKDLKYVDGKYCFCSYIFFIFEINKKEAVLKACHGGLDPPSPEN